MGFEFMDKGNALQTCVKYAGRMHIFNEGNMSNLIRSTMIADQFDVERLKSIIDAMCNPANVDIYLRSKTFEGQVQEEVEFYKTKHTATKFSEELLAKITSPNCPITNCKLDLPPPNSLVPKNFDILDKDEANSALPSLILSNEDTQVFYKKDDKFERPKAFVNLKLYTPDNGFGQTLEGRVFVCLWESVASEYMREFNYMAEMAKLEFKFSVLHDNIDFSWSGFNDSMPNYVAETVTRLSQLGSQDLAAIFEQQKEQLTNEWKNAYLEQSYQQAFRHFESLFQLQGFQLSDQR